MDHIKELLSYQLCHSWVKVQHCRDVPEPHN